MNADTELSRIRQIIEDESAAIANIPVGNGSEYEHALDIIHLRVHRGDGKLIVSGMGKAGEIGKNMATTFCSTGTPAVFLDPAAAQHGDIGIIRPSDALILISNSGETREILELIALTDALCGFRIPIIAITGNPESPLAETATVVLLTGNPPEVCPLGMSPTTSTTVMTVIGDILITQTMLGIKFSMKDYAKRHHGGYLGEKARG
jgi:arabinose-5-phosphate isomerase